MDAFSNKYTYETERNKRKDSPEDLKALLAQELAFVGKTYVIADLPVLRKEGTHLIDGESSKNDKTIPIPFPTQEEIYTIERGYNEHREKTDYSQMLEIANSLIQEYSSDIQSQFDAQKIKDRDPATIVSLVTFLVAKKMDYFDELVEIGRYWNNDIPKEERPGFSNLPPEKQELILQIDKMSANDLLKTGLGVCRHMTHVAVELFNTIKLNDSTGNLSNTHLYDLSLLSTTVQADVTEDHAALMMISKYNNEVVVSLTDPTFISGEMNGKADEVHERFSDTRLAAAINLLTSDIMQKSIGEQLPVSECKKLLEKQLKRIINTFSKDNFDSRFDLDFFSNNIFSVISSYFTVLEKITNGHSSISNEDRIEGDNNASKILIELFENSSYYPSILLEILSKLNPINHLDQVLDVMNRIKDEASKLDNAEYNYDMNEIFSKISIQISRRLNIQKLTNEDTFQESLAIFKPIYDILKQTNNSNKNLERFYNY